jgi:transcriptional regulator with GAF, ATPase, and Fis domain
MTMNPRLTFIIGPLEGTTFALTDEVRIGRDVSNQLCITDPAVSRQHCLITKDQEKYKIIDLDSFNGTFINGVPIKEQTLEHGDQISIGDTLALFLLHEVENAMALGQAHLDGGEIVTRSTIQLQREDALYLRPDKVLASLPPSARVARDLNALLKISTTLNSIRGLKPLQEKLLELIFEVIPAERGVILLIGDGADRIVSLFSRNKLLSIDDAVQVSRTVTSKVLREGMAILSNDIWQNDAFGKADSLVASRTRSLICVPLALFENIIGAVYLDTSDTTAGFDEAHLQLMTAIANISAIALENALHVEWLENENRRLRAETHVKHNMIGDSAPMREIYRLIARVAPTDSTVLIRGESGTGKELVAHAIHLNSPRASKPFVAFNCAAFVEPLLESELFGHEKGAFANAIVQKKGLLEVANGGTVFLDEIGELSLAIQAKLLRVLQEREFRRVGGTQTIKVDIRLIAATNKNLENAINQREFREDLYYRLNVVSFFIPPLRERAEDIPLLVNYFAAKYGNKLSRCIGGISPEARNRLMKYAWPGNVRELENAIERAVALGSSEFIMPEDLPETVLETGKAHGLPNPKFYDAVKETKRELILKAIEEANGSYTEAAKILGIHPNNLHRLARTLNLKSPLNK